MTEMTMRELNAADHGRSNGSQTLETTLGDLVVALSDAARDDQEALAVLSNLLLEERVMIYMNGFAEPAT